MVTDNTSIYIVKGAGNRGKSSLIFNLVKKLHNNGAVILKNPYNQKIKLDDYVCDYCFILTYKGKNILIMSKGDNQAELNKQWDNFKDTSEKIDIIIGACRTRGQTVWWWNSLFSNKVYFKHNDIVTDIELQKKHNIAGAEKLIKLIFDEK